MKKVLVLGAAYVLFGFTTSGTTVNVCLGKYAKRYHYTTDCRGLNNCQAEITKTSLDQAVSSGKTLCGYED